MSALGKMIGHAFQAPRLRAVDPHRRARETAKKLAALYAIEIEALRPGYNVWPPKSLSDSAADPFDGDHYARDWDEVLERITAYAGVCRRPRTETQGQTMASMTIPEMIARLKKMGLPRSEREKVLATFRDAGQSEALEQAQNYLARSAAALAGAKSAVNALFELKI